MTRSPRHEDQILVQCEGAIVNVAMIWSSSFKAVLHGLLAVAKRLESSKECNLEEVVAKLRQIDILHPPGAGRPEGETIAPCDAFKHTKSCSS